MGCAWTVSASVPFVTLASLLCAEGVAVYKDIPFMTSSGAITSSLQDARVS